MATLLDPQGNPVDLSILREPMVTPTMTGVRSPFADVVSAKLAPASLAKLLQAAADGDSHSYLTLAEEMEERDLHYASVLGTRKRALSGLEIKVEAASDAAEDQEPAEALRELLQSPDMEEHVEDLADAFGKGFSVMEMNWQTTATRWTPILEWHDPRLFRTDLTGKAIRLKTLKDPLGLELPPYKFIVHKARFKSGIPIRGGLARPVAWAHMMKTYTVRDWIAFLEVYGMPLRIGRYQANATPEDRATLRRAVRELGHDAAAILPTGMEIEFEELAHGSANGELFQGAAEWADRQVSKAVLGQTMTSDSGSSRAQAEVHDGVRLDLREADARAMGRTLSRDLARPFVDLNFGPRRIYPRIVLFIPKPEDLKAKVDALEKLVPLGLRVSESEVRDKLGFSDPGEDRVLAQVATPSASGAPGGGGSGPATNARALNASQRVEEGGGDPDSLDELEALATGQWERIMPAMLQPLAKLATDKSVNSLEAFRSRLAGVVDEMSTDQLQELVAQARFMANTAGAAGAPIE